ncbi:MAG: hypothetical protein HXX08_03765 [Chloroflexi bacterium]|uniref:Uncharacterized protein n=1 Tax=Candidatus Chlorohelix allophototropha TaxID=3003348 RepID=A0A8T7M2V9_9CHLR|nr:hypothetical protein [Chloroflexota bacterium]WJW66856.1 hypothetical protein OZ401_000101 [Chloroflexota bacterium L227-S17]
MTVFGNVIELFQQQQLQALLLDIGFIILALALFWFARILGELLEIIQKPPVEGLTRIAGWLLILTFSIPHYVANIYLYPNLTGDSNMWVALWIFRTISNVGLLVASILALIPVVLYWRWTRE